MSSIYKDKTEKVLFDPVFDKVIYEVAFCLKIKGFRFFYIHYDEFCTMQPVYVRDHNYHKSEKC